MKKILRVVLFPIAFVAVMALVVIAYLYGGRDHMEHILDGLVNAW